MRELVLCFPSHRGEVLVREAGVSGEGPASWGVVTAAVEGEHDVEDRCRELLVDELDLEPDSITMIEQGDRFEVEEDGTEFCVYPAIAHIEAERRSIGGPEGSRWIEPEDVTLLDTHHMLDSGLKRALRMRFSL